MASLVKGIDGVFNTLPTKFIWEYENESSKYIAFDRTATRKLEQAFSINGAGGKLDVKMKSGKTYTCTFEKMKWKDPANTGYRSKERNLRRNPHITPLLTELINLEDTKEAYLKTKRKAIQTLFDTFKMEPDEDDDEGEEEQLDILGFCEALDIDCTKLEILIICYYCHATTFPVITKTEFVQGVGRMECDSIKNIKQKLPQLLRRVNFDTNGSKKQPSPFMTTLFKYLYLLFKTQCGEGTKKLPMVIMNVDEDDGEETVVFDLLLIMDLLYLNKWPLYTHYKIFLTQCMEKVRPDYSMQQIKSYSTDEWNMTLKFACQYPTSCDGYEDGAWPNVFDCFGELYWEQKGSGGETKE